MKKPLSLLLPASVLCFAIFGCVTKELTPEEKAVVEQCKAQLPFGIAIAEHKAVVDSPIAARIAEPVANDAEIVCDTVNNGLIEISFFPCDKEGIVVGGKKPALILLRDGNKTTLDKTIYGKKLVPGFYKMDVTSGNKTSRVVIEIAPPAPE